ncbi:glycosyltransferase family 4 protein [Pseudomonas sp. BE134]|uniref:glycosyltransferase family 4 protein n=1 Tax=Pseudomonas sp. BE134 TaxID=2817843 RepID=UPI0028665229|nr:glycosyltransferase family 4 protein [Pseudomonas sp. BE134]MDR6929417.1 glycosyltransferase involved in cell wall biosynthesis [Pseudomonas sp. BE134]
MRILLISQYFWPESFVINDLAIKLAGKGHEVTVATGKPNYPDGDIYDGYSAKGVQYERYSSLIDVVRVPVYPRGKGGAKKLLLNYFSFVVMGLWYFPKLLRGEKIDVIIVFAPSPIVQVIPAILLKWLKGAHLAVWVQDLWPESLSATGFVKKSWVIKSVGHVVRGIYKCCDTLLLQSRAFFEPTKKYASLEKLVYFPNSIDMKNSSVVGNVIPGALKSELESHFSVVFAGNIGTAQSMESIVEAASLLKQEAGLRIFIVGSGSMLEWVASQKKSLHLDNLVLPGRFPADAMPEIFECAAALLVSLNDEEIFSYTIPSKIQAYLAAGRPIIAALRGEGARVISDSGAGLVCPPASGQLLAATILALKESSSVERDKMGVAGLKYFNENFDMDFQSGRLIDILTARLNRK